MNEKEIKHETMSIEQKEQVLETVICMKEEEFDKSRNNFTEEEWNEVKYYTENCTSYLVDSNGWVFPNY